MTAPTPPPGRDEATVADLTNDLHRLLVIAAILGSPHAPAEDPYRATAELLFDSGWRKPAENTVYVETVAGWLEFAERQWHLAPRDEKPRRLVAMAEAVLRKLAMIR